MSDADSLRLAFGALAPRKVDQLIERYGSSHNAVKAVVGGRSGLNSDVQREIAVSAHERSEQLFAKGVRFVDSSDTAFPRGILNFEGSPRWLFVKGELRAGPSIGIVGSRSCTAYGLELAEAYGRVAAGTGWNVVSGLAKGIDAAVHRGAASAGPHRQMNAGDIGQCAAVLGCGIDVVYPRSNASLYEQVAESGGVILSEFPPGTRPDAWRFPTRNRIIAGLSNIVLVVEASERGGALITARIAIDYGIPVYAVPGDVDRATSAGTNALIRDGAFPVFGPEDLATLLDLLRPVVNLRSGVGMSADQ
ncbi:MAG: DNA-processing protein DprA [Actinomycetota bacterium]|nr:DNA-processing protein DprA [Actinomycetota bacterium]